MVTQFLDLSHLPGWAIPALVSGVVVVLILLSYLVLRRKSSTSETPVATLISKPPAKASIPGTTGKSKEKRSALRRGGSSVDVLVSDEQARAKPVSGMVIDRSARGLCLSMEVTYEVGDVLSVRRSSSGTMVPWVRVVVKNCRAISNNYEVGCEFLEPPPSSIMMTFG